MGSHHPSVNHQVRPEGEKAKWQKTVVLTKEIGDAEYLPIRTIEGTGETEGELAYALLKRDSERSATFCLQPQRDL
jgi:hypothetical protein